MKRLIKLTESDLHNIVKESVKSMIKENIEDFSEMEEEVYSVSSPLRNSTAFQRAMYYIRENNHDLYVELIKTEYNEMI